MTATAYDAVIAGAGLSGLSLAAHLAAGPWRDRSVLLVDDASAPPTQAWASWAAGPELLAPAVSASYDRVRVHAGGSGRVLPLGRYRYRVVRRAGLRRAVAELIARCPNFRIVVGRVERVSGAGEVARTVVDGRVISSTWAFDGVTRRAPTGPPDARLAFTGWEVRYPRPVFDPETPVLFDFRVPDVPPTPFALHPDAQQAREAGGAHAGAEQRAAATFVYVLPTDARRALVELTSFVPRRAEPPPATHRAALLAGYLRAHVGDGYDIVRTESAVLPLRAFPGPRRHGRVLDIGAGAGLLKASTGYAYERIQRDSAAIADSLARHGHPFAGTARTRGRHRLLDAVLLETLDREPARLEDTFARLFAAHPAERVLAFLDEDTTAGQELRLIASLPPGPYLRAAATRLLR
jgi:lycopene beta-cyclase